VEAQRRNATRNLVLVVGLASIMTAGLLWWASERAPEAQAFRKLEQDSWTGTIDAAPYSDVSPAWDSTEPVTTFVSEVSVTRWDIPLYNVVITFPSYLFYNKEQGAVFTFTPQSGYSLPPPLLSTSYFFRLWGTYIGSDYPVSYKGYKHVDIELTYQDPDELGGVQESTLKLYRYAPIVGGDDWVLQPGSVDPTHNRACFETDQSGVFGLGGYGSQIFFPLVARSGTMRSSGMDDGGGKHRVR